MSGFFSYDAARSPDPGPGPEPAEAPRAILAELSSDDWAQFIRFTVRRRYPEGATVREAGDGDRALGFIASGRLRVQAAGAPESLRGEGEVFGMLGFLDGSTGGAAVSVAPGGAAELLLLSPEALQQLAAWQPRIAVALLRDLGAHVARRLRQLQAGD